MAGEDPSEEAQRRFGPRDESWELPENLRELPAEVFADTTPALKRLGTLPFAGGTFPLMGFFASVYEHISVQASAMLKPNEAHDEQQR